MATTKNTYTGNGTNKLFSITFPYIETTDVDVYLNGTLQTITTQYIFANATTIEFVTAPANGATVVLKRSTDDADLQATFFPGSSIKASDLNLDFDQVLYIAQETANTANDATTAASSATTTANTALSNSTAAVTTANTASSNASAAVSTANAASTTASNAVTTANSAVNTANSATSTANTALSTANTAISTANAASSSAASAVSTANTAASNASAAVSTANTASTNASNAVSTANTASTNASTAVTTANNAVTTANAATVTANTASTNASNAVTTANAASADAANAIAAISAASLYVVVAAVANIPTTGLTNNQGIQVLDSTGIQSFTPLSGIPAGFVGSSALYVRIRYSTSTSSWVWSDYAANDPENRYLAKTGGTLTGALTFAGAQPTATTSAANIVQLTDSVSSTSVTTAATPASVKVANDAAVAAQSTANTANTTANAALPKAGGTMTGVIVFDTSQTKASTSVYGITQLTDSVSSTSTTTAATPASVKLANDAAVAAQSTANTAVTNAASAQTTANAALPKAGGTMTGDITLNAQSDLRFADADSSNWLAFQAPATVTSNVTWTLPATDAAVSGYALKSNGAGQLSWGLAGGALGSGTNQIFYENDQTVTGSYSITAGKNAMTAGPVTVNSGITVTVPSGSYWSIV
jgi:hypothetical protein